MVILTFLIVNNNEVAFNIKIYKFFLSKLFKILIMGVFCFGLSILKFCLNILINRLFF